MKELKEFSSEEEYVPRSIQYIVVHCSATRANIPFTEEQLLKCHLQRGFKYIGYHFYITRDGELHHCRPVSEPGAHVRGFVYGDGSDIVLAVAVAGIALHSVGNI